MNSTSLDLFVIVVAILGLFVTAYILFVITFTKQVNTVNGILLVQLAAVEFTLSFLFLVCNMTHVIHTFSVEGEPDSGTCTVCGILFTFLRPISVWTVCGLNCDRYYAISAPLHYGSLVNPRRTITAICILWALSFLLCLLPLFYPSPYIYNFLLFTCIPDFKYDLISACYNLLLVISVFLIPLILIVTCNLKVFMIARYHKHRIASAIFEVTLSAQVTITHQRNPFSPLLWANKFKGRSAFFTVLQLVGSFLILYVPYYSAIFWESISHHIVTNKSDSFRIPHSVTTTASVLLVCSSPINGLLYGIKSKILRKSFQNYWRKKMTKNEVNQEIQARTPSTCGSRRPSLTPLGFFNRQNYRRPSEASIETQKSNLLGGVSCSRLQQCLNEITFRPGSSPGLGILSSRNESFSELKRTCSFRTDSYGSSISSLRLQGQKMQNDVNNRHFHQYNKYNDESEMPQLESSNENSPLHRVTSPNLFIQRFRKLEMTGYNKLKSKAKHSDHSPRILITRAFSEENDSTANHSPPPKPSSSVCTLLIDNSWRTGSNERMVFNYDQKSQHNVQFSESSSSEDDVDVATRPPSTRLESPPLKKQPEKVTIDEKIAEKQMKFGSSSNSNTIHSWPCSTKKSIQFRIGSVVLSEGHYSLSSSSSSSRSKNDFKRSHTFV